MKSIPDQWIKEYVDKLIDLAKTYDHDNIMYQAILLRVHSVLDMVEAFRESENKH